LKSTLGLCITGWRRLFFHSRKTAMRTLLKEYQEGDLCEGQDADVVAQEIADHLKVSYCPMFGRGSALRECCRAVREYLTK